MKIELTTQQEEDRAAFRAFVDEEVLPYADQYDQEESIPGEMIAKLAGQGYLGAILPAAYEGRDMAMLTYGLLNEELGRGCASVRTLVMLQNMIAQTLFKWGSHEQKERWLERIASGQTVVAFALTEPEVGSDAKNIKTTAARVGDSYVINGRKQWITMGQIADLFLIFGRCEGKICAFLVERETPGLTIKPVSGMLGLRASLLAELHLNDCRIPQENLVGGEGFGLMPVGLFALDIGRYSIAWGCVGLAQACLEACLHHTSTRKQFGVYLKEHQLIQQMMTDMVVNVKAARLLCYQAGYLKEAGAPDAITESLAAKYFASTMAVRVAGDAVQIHGALGCSSQHPAQRHLRDAKIMEIIEGTTQIHQIKIAQFSYQTYTNR